MNIKKYLTSKNIIIAITFVLILVTSILTKQKFVLIFPVFISLFIMAFQADANRYAYLAGGINAVIYTGVYVYLGLYASAASALLFSFPLQLITFINWKKRAYGNSVVFKKMSGKVQLGLTVAFALSFAALYIILTAMGSNYAILDNASTLIGIAVSVLTMLAYIEYSYLWVLNGALQLALNIQVMLNNPAHITYVIFSIYSAYCIILAFINVRKLYNEQKEVLKSANYDFIRCLDNVNAKEAEKAFLGSTYRVSDDGYTFGELKKVPVTSPHGPAVSSDGRFVYVGTKFNTDTLNDGDIACYIMNDGDEFELTGTIENITSILGRA